MVDYSNLDQDINCFRIKLKNDFQGSRMFLKSCSRKQPLSLFDHEAPEIDGNHMSLNRELDNSIINKPKHMFFCC
ncbi:hypothetical protein M153_3230006656 [Pseudoloma neurophilia]|uniref:Uncharacterized protein n=1 Tax=Pseudoloma neurophilia TaxID=146866 RepID=A0A0R0M558_9MICR|nr:hypothetical protein M153_3230006656 [Pseudoloma neurophilia]